jgi:hypothetical protein
MDTFAPLLNLSRQVGYRVVTSLDQATALPVLGLFSPVLHYPFLFPLLCVISVIAVLHVAVAFLEFFPLPPKKMMQLFLFPISIFFLYLNPIYSYAYD